MHGPKILLLDDDRIHNDLNLMVMKLMGLTDVDICTSGKEALPGNHYYLFWQVSVFRNFLVKKAN